MSCRSHRQGSTQGSTPVTELGLSGGCFVASLHIYAALKGCSGSKVSESERTHRAALPFLSCVVLANLHMQALKASYYGCIWRLGIGANAKRQHTPRRPTLRTGCTLELTVVRACVALHFRSDTIQC